jgi:hypothetical protein
VRRHNPRLAHPFLDKLATIEAFQFRIFSYRMDRRFAPQITQQRVALLVVVALASTNSVTFSTPTRYFNISNDVGRVKGHGLFFVVCGHTFRVSADALVPFERVTTLLLR